MKKSDFNRLLGDSVNDYFKNKTAITSDSDGPDITDILRNAKAGIYSKYDQYDKEDMEFLVARKARLKARGQLRER